MEFGRTLGDLSCTLFLLSVLHKYLLMAAVESRTRDRPIFGLTQQNQFYVHIWSCDFQVSTRKKKLCLKIFIHGHTNAKPQELHVFCSCSTSSKHTDFVVLWKIHPITFKTQLTAVLWGRTRWEIQEGGFLDLHNPFPLSSRKAGH